MAGVAVILVWCVQLGCLQLAHAATPKVDDNAVGYSRIVVATPGLRRYTYDIAHDPEGRDFSINLDPLDSDLDFNNYLAEPEGRFLPQYQHIIPVHDNYGGVQLHLKHPTHEEMEKSSRAIQAVHGAYSKNPVKPQAPMNLQDFDLGIMGYGDFMDPHDEPRANHPYHQPYTGQNPGISQSLGHYRNTYLLGRPGYISQPKMSYIPRNLIYSKIGPQKPLVQKVENNQAQFSPFNLQRALFVPAFDEKRLDGLADKAYSKVFMAHGFSKPVPRFYPKNGVENEGIDVAKTLFVPVVIVPSTQQTLLDKQDIDRSSSVGFESRKIIKKRA